MIRRNARLRREYLYRRTLQNDDRERMMRKLRIKEALEQGRAISEEDLRKEAEEGEYGITRGDGTTDKKRKRELDIDDEYSQAGIEDPKILLTTSHDPSDRLKRFVKEMRYIFPNTQRMNRGNQQVKEIVEICKQNGFTDLVMIHEHRGEPDALIISHMPHGPTAYFGLMNCVMRHDTNDPENISEAFPHLIFHNFKTKLGARVATILKYLFPVPKPDTKRIMTFANDNDFISFRHHVYKKVAGKIVLTEIGPRFEMKLFQIKLGTIEMAAADKEWVLRPYMNSSKKRQAIGGALGTGEEEDNEYDK